MARKRRLFGETGIYHIILRGNNQEALFYNNSDREFFLCRLKKYVLELNIDLYAYCLMGNHVHLLIGKGNDAMPLFVKKLTCSYVYYFNHKYERSGHLFQGRYKSEPIEEINYFKSVYRYILLNPEKAGICVYNKYEWNSYAFINNKESYLNNNFVKDVFFSEKSIQNYLNQANDDICMENIESYNSDDDVKAIFISNLFGILSPAALCRDTDNVLMDRLKLLKSMGISINQISRLTGISKGIIKLA